MEIGVVALMIILIAVVQMRRTKQRRPPLWAWVVFILATAYFVYLVIQPGPLVF